MLFLLLVSFLAGILTVFAPCVLPVLPVILSGGIQNKDPYRPVIITISLGLSIVLFTLLLKASTLLIDIPQKFWSTLSGVIIIFFGITAVWPNAWKKISGKFSSGSNQALGKATQKKGRWGTILLGASLGPVFASCSPVYFLILATVLPASFLKGLFALLAYGSGLAFVMFLISFLGQKFLAKSKWVADPKGWFRRGLGILFLIVGIGILLGWDKVAESWFLEHSLFFDLSSFEQGLIEKIK